jgi:hypothetical protein
MSKAYQQLARLAIAKLTTNKLNNENMQAFTESQLYRIKDFKSSLVQDAKTGKE